MTGPLDDYTHLRIYLTRSRLGESEAAVKELRNYLESRSRGIVADWPIKVGEFLADQITESALFGAAESPDERINAEQHCEAWFYAGTKRLLSGDQTAAASCFEKAIATHAQILIEYGSAVQELRLLEAPKNPDKKQVSELRNHADFTP